MMLWMNHRNYTSSAFHFANAKNSASTIMTVMMNLINQWLDSSVVGTVGFEVSASAWEAALVAFL